MGELDSVEYYTLFHFIVSFVGRDSQVYTLRDDQIPSCVDSIVCRFHRVYR